MDKAFMNLKNKVQKNVECVPGEILKSVLTTQTEASTTSPSAINSQIGWDTMTEAPNTLVTGGASEQSNTKDKETQFLENMSHFEQELTYLELDNSEIEDNCKLKTEDFQSGIDGVTELAGQITALVNCGVSPDEAFKTLMDYKMSSESLKVTLKLAELNAENSLELGKLGYIGQEAGKI